VPQPPARQHAPAQNVSLAIGRVAIHGRTVHFRAAPQLRGDWLRRIDQWIGYANAIVEE
jgi:hypothetical protein